MIWLSPFGSNDIAAVNTKFNADTIFKWFDNEWKKIYASNKRAKKHTHAHTHTSKNQPTIKGKQSIIHLVGIMPFSRSRLNQIKTSEPSNNEKTKSNLSPYFIWCVCVRWTIIAERDSKRAKESKSTWKKSRRIEQKTMEANSCDV